jgi:hypothetical protein
MTDVTQAQLTNNWPVANVPNPMSRSLRFRASASAYLSRTPSVAGNRKTWTFSAWIKRGSVSNEATPISGGATTGRLCVFFNSSGQLISDVGGTGTFDQSTAVYRDPAAWYHFVWQFDTTQATAANRSRMYMNGVAVALTNTRTFTQNADYEINNSVLQTIGTFSNSIGTYNLDGYMTEINFIDGQALDPTSFGQYDQFSNWTSKKYTGTYGVNGFYLPFSNNSSTGTLGLDFSGNSNTWTTNNISVTAGSTYDSMVDVPTQWIPYNTTGDVGATFRGNYCVLNPLDKYSGITMAEANLKVQLYVLANGSCGFRGTSGVSSGKWYWEVLVGANQASRALGSIGIDTLNTSISSINTVGTGVLSTSYIYFQNNGNKINNNTSTAYGATYTTNDVIGVALDMDVGTLTFYKNGVSQGTAFSSLSGTFAPSGALYSDTITGSYIADMYYNFGQRPFSYTPPSGFKTLCTTNLPTSTIQQGNLFFNALTYAGSASNQTISGLSFQPDFIWFKERTTSGIDHNLFDSARSNYGSRLISNATNAEAASGAIISVSSTGYSLLGGVSNTNDSSGRTYVTWNWKAGGTAVTNTAGTINSQVSANTTAGFSVVTYTGNNTTTPSPMPTVGHGLGVAPSLVISKSRNNAGVDSGAWFVWTSALSTDSYLRLNTTAATASVSGGGGGTMVAPTSTVFSTPYVSGANINANNYVAYCFAAVAGYSAFGSYTGNGSADGSFVYLGFRPRFVMIKRSDAGAVNWYIFDTARDTYNAAGLELYPNLSNAEADGRPDLDILSNGFKIRSTSGGQNTSGATYIYACFAEYPFKSALAR